MATSGITTFSQTTIGLIEDAFDELGLLSEGRSLSSEQYDKAKRKLNSMISTWQSQDNINIWKNKEATLFLEQGVPTYQLGNDQANATENFVETTVSIDATAGASSITVDDATGIADGYFIGIVLTDGSAQFTTVNGAPAGNVVTITDVLEQDVNSGAAVVSYETKISKPLRLTQVYYQGLGQTSSDIYAIHYNRDEYFRLADKTTQGAPIQYYYNVNIEDVTLYVWPTSATTFDKLKFTYQPAFDIFNNNQDTPDFAPEWYEALVYNLAKRIGSSYGMTRKTAGPYSDVADEADRLYREMRAATRPSMTIKVVNEFDDYY